MERDLDFVFLTDAPDRFVVAVFVSCFSFGMREASFEERAAVGDSRLRKLLYYRNSIIAWIELSTITINSNTHQPSPSLFLNIQ